MKKLSDNKGVVLIASYLVIVVLVTLGMAFITRSMSERRLAERELLYTQALHIAEAGLSRIKEELFANFSNTTLNPNQLDMTWFDNLANTQNPSYDFSAVTINGIGTYQITQPAAQDITPLTNPDGRDILLSVTGTVQGVTRRIAVVLRYQINTAQVFDFAYFINNYGWMWGGSIRNNGNMRSNGDFSIRWNPTINGDIYASANPETGAVGDITISNPSQYNSRDVNNYNSWAPSQARPAMDDNSSYPEYYDGTTTQYPQQEMVNMPYLGDLSQYRALAVSQGGTVTSCGTILINATYSGDGLDGINGTADDETIVLIGTDACPIEVNGPVVVNKDVIIKGKVTGQGTIYAGRNVHILDDIVYVQPPSWPKPDTDPEATKTANQSKDLFGLAAKGNVILGNYTISDWNSNIVPYIDASGGSITMSYIVDASDADIGYVTGYDIDGNPYFDGNYTVDDGGYKDDGYGGSESRKYYEASLSDSYIDSIAKSTNQGRIETVDAVVYTNHLLAGRGQNMQWNGSVVSRDECIVFNGTFGINYDARLYGDGGGVDITLPLQLQSPQIISWREN